MGGSAPMPPAMLWVRPKPRLLKAPKSSFKPFRHFVKPEIHLISSENRRFSASGGPLGVQTPHRIGAGISLGGSGGPPRGPPDAENRRFGS